jgi:hypothetical protein
MGPFVFLIVDFRFTILIVTDNHKSEIVNLVDLRGFEPLTSSVRLRRAPSCATGPRWAKGILLEGQVNVKLILEGFPGIFVVNT